MGHVDYSPATVSGSQAGMKPDLRFKPPEVTYIPALPSGLSSAGHVLRNHVGYTPAWGVNRAGTYYWDENERVTPENGFSLDWWTDTAIFRHRALLVSAFYGMDKWDFRDFYKIPTKDFTFIADSGGYQVWSQGVSPDPIDILRWEEHNADVALTLDSPPVKDGMLDAGGFGTRSSEDSFKESIRISRRNYEVMHRNRDPDSKLQLLKVIHGYTLKELTQFHAAMKDLTFDGHGFGANQNDTSSIALVLGYAQTIEQGRVHMFLATGLNTAPLIIFAKRFFKNLTFDSASFSITGARYRKYYMPYNITKGISFGDSFTSKKLVKLPCTCPVCKLTTPEEFNKSGSLPGGLIALHNLYKVLEYYHTLDALADSPDDYIEFLKGTTGPETIRMVEYLLCVEENDFEYANNKFHFSETGQADRMFG